MSLPLAALMNSSEPQDLGRSPYNTCGQDRGNGSHSTRTCFCQLPGKETQTNVMLSVATGQQPVRHCFEDHFGNDCDVCLRSSTQWPQRRFSKAVATPYLQRIARAEIKGKDQVCLPLCSKDQRIGRIYCQASINQRDDFVFIRCQ